VKALKGDVQVRHGVQENWTKLKVGNILKPDDTIKTGKNSSVTLTVDGKTVFVVQALAMLDVKDIRDVSKEDLLLSITSENVRNIPAQRKSDKITIASATAPHGTDASQSDTKIAAQSLNLLAMKLQGAKALFDNFYFASYILTAKHTLRNYTNHIDTVPYRLLIAKSFEKLGLLSRSLEEYDDLAKEKLNPKQKAEVEQNLKRLKEAVLKG
jgi:hypothetical protein